MMALFSRPFLALASILIVLLAPPAQAAPMDLTHAVIQPLGADPLTAKAAVLLRDEVARRNGVTLAVSQGVHLGAPVILLGVADEVGERADLDLAPRQPEGYAIWVDNPSKILAVGRDGRGVMFAAGRLVRLLELAPGAVRLAADTRISTAPRYPLRGVQVGFREMPNSYDAWDMGQFEQYLRDMILFGANSVELVPLLDPNLIDGRAMKRTAWGATQEQAAMIADYGLDVWLWSAALEDLADPVQAQEALAKRRAMLQSLVHVDALFVPGGDDGENPAQVLMPWLKDLAAILHEIHPNAQLWVSNQTFTQEENVYFFNFLEKEGGDWLTGVVYGPWMRMTIQEMRARTPERYLLRSYPDITHTARCQFPVSNWDRRFAFTLGREPVCPRPQWLTGVFHNQIAASCGFLAYSEGIHDDFNKFLWLALGWDPETTPETTLTDYSRTFFGPAETNTVVQGLSRMEQCWASQAIDNPLIPGTLELWRKVASTDNWRAQMYLFRALFDAYVRRRAEAEARRETEALAALSQARDVGPESAVAQTRLALAAQNDGPEAAALRAELQALGLVLLHSIGYQLSVKAPYYAKNTERGALLDFLDAPLNNRVWMEQEMDRALAHPARKGRLKALDGILKWEDPGQGGFYDDLGDPWRQPHLVAGAAPAEDPACLRIPQNEFMESLLLRQSWRDQAETLYGAPLRMHYEGLDPKKHYRLRVVEGGRFKPEMRLVADGNHVLHEGLGQTAPDTRRTFRVPKAATRDGVLDLEWQLLSGRGCQVAEVWLQPE